MDYISAFARASGITTPQAPARQSSSISTTKSPATPALDRLRDHQTISPMTRTRKWLEGPTPKKPQKSPGMNKVKGSRITKSTGQNGNAKRKSFWGVQLLTSLFGKEQDQECKDDFEGETIIADEGPVPTTEHDNDFTLVEDDEVIFEAEKSDHYLSYNDPRVHNWTHEEIWLFNKLSRLGKEPLFVTSWTMDFPSFPAYLFSSDPARVFINNNHSTISYATRALNELIMAASLARAQLSLKKPPERPLFREINKYYKWSTFDGRFIQKTHIPVVAIASAKPKESVESVVGRVTDKLYSLARQYREKWRHPDCHEDHKNQVYTHEMPTLFGFVIKYTVVAIVTCDSSVPNKPIRTLATYDWNKGNGQDVWHALAVAITMVRARNYMMQLDEEGELGEVIVESDPDA